MRRFAAAAVCAALNVSLSWSAIVPRPSPELTIKLAGGGQIQLSLFRGKVVALEFLLTHCPHCQRASQTMDKLFKEYGAKGFQPLGVAINQPADKLVPEYIRQFGLTYPVGFATNDAAVNYLQHPIMTTMMMPQLVFIDRKGVIRAQYPGTDAFFQDEEKNIRAMVVSLLKESGAKRPVRAAK